ncbi:putative oxalate decarboxylase oxdD [Coleophoma cylindrospora]|uniref:Putative oxalate decarboxylase oxdD n=1 Tax=Coleophoma cylindrospora TaxID=1849047 RepID=A0A3D8QGV8_9HELO|nr:putative oxalate decarboxylase oxdD [Coleophoma cylindrospora]
MPRLFKLSYISFLASILPTVLALPAPQLNYEENSGPVGGVDPETLPTVTTPSGSLYGNEQLLGEAARPSPVSGGDSAVVSEYPLVNGQLADSKLGLYLDFNSVEDPQPIRGTLGQTDPGPGNPICPAKTLESLHLFLLGDFEYEKLNPDRFAPPGTDSGSLPNAMWPLALSSNRLGTGKTSGWARQQNIAQLPAATEMAGVDMRLAPHAYRELHWHTASEWSLMLKGCVRLSAVNENGESFIDDICAGDVWFFPAGVPHSIQALDEGAEFLLVFDNGAFNEDGTFLVSEMFLRNPKSVLSKNLETPVSALDNLPSDELYIFNGTPAPANISEQNITSSAGILPVDQSYTYHFSQQEPYVVPGGSVKVIDSTTFPVAANFAAALVTIQPGAMRELHWHLTSDEWNYVLQGSARITIYLAPDSSQTFDYTAGDVGYIPAANSHYIENTGTEDVIFLEVLQAPKFTDISVAQWLALTPKQVVQDTLHLPDETLAGLPKEKTYLKPGNRNLTALAADPNGTGAYEESTPGAAKRRAIAFST